MSLFNSKRVVVTGGAGFAGTHLVDLLVSLGADVVVIDDGRNQTDYAYFRNVPQHRIDVGNPGALTKYFEGAFAVFNLAAHVAGVIYNQSNHLEMFHENMRVQTAPVIAAERAGVQHFLQVSSVCVYSPDHNHPALECNGWAGEPVAANNGYSWAKRMGERAALWSKIPHVVIVRPSNLYGPRDHFDDRAHVIPALIRKAMTADDVITVNGTGREVREFLHVEDAVRGMVAALERGQHQTIYNLGGQAPISIRDLVALIQQVTDTTDKAVMYSSDYDPGDPGRWSDATAMQRDTGWEAMVDLETGLRGTVDWYRRTPLATFRRRAD
jgi:nucleoside-diphosphate-sugar epimerase